MADSPLVPSPAEPSVYGQRLASGSPFINIIHIAFSEKLVTLLAGIFLSSSLQPLRNCIKRHLRKISQWFWPFQITLCEETRATSIMILTTVAQSRRHFLTLYDVNTQFKPRDVLADCVYFKTVNTCLFDHLDHSGLVLVTVSCLLKNLSNLLCRSRHHLSICEKWFKSGYFG